MGWNGRAGAGVGLAILWDFELQFRGWDLELSCKNVWMGIEYNDKYVLGYKTITNRCFKFLLEVLQLSLW